MIATSIWDLELKEDNKSCVVVISCVSQLLPDRKPCWRFVVLNMVQNVPAYNVFKKFTGNTLV